MTRYLGCAVIGLSMSLGASAMAQGARTLPDGTLIVSADAMAAEMITEEQKTKRKYAGKAIQVEAEISAKLLTDRYLELTLIATPRGYQGYKKFWCKSFDKSSMQASATLPTGSKATVAGIYQPDTRGDQTAKDVQNSSDGLAYRSTDWAHTIRLDSCVVLTGNPKGEGSRGDMAAEAAGAQEQKQKK